MTAQLGFAICRDEKHSGSCKMAVPAGPGHISKADLGTIFFLSLDLHA